MKLNEKYIKNKRERGRVSFDYFATAVAGGFKVMRFY